MQQGSLWVRALGLAVSRDTEGASCGYGTLRP